MSAQVLVNIAKKITSSYAGGGNGNITLKNFNFKVKAEGVVTVGELSVVWKFEGVDANYADGKFSSSGKSEFNLTLKDLKLVHEDGEFGLGEVVIEDISDLQNLSLILPFEDIKKLFTNIK